MTKVRQRGMTSVGQRKLTEVALPFFVILRGAKRSRSTQAQRLGEIPEPGSRDYARDDDSWERTMVAIAEVLLPGCRRALTNEMGYPRRSAVVFSNHPAVA